MGSCPMMTKLLIDVRNVVEMLNVDADDVTKNASMQND